MTKAWKEKKGRQRVVRRSTRGGLTSKPKGEKGVAKRSSIPRWKLPVPRGDGGERGERPTRGMGLCLTVKKGENEKKHRKKNRKVGEPRLLKGEKTAGTQKQSIRPAVSRKGV